MRMRSAAEVRRLAHKPAVGRGTNTHRKQPGVSQAVGYFFEQSQLITYCPVRDEDDLAQAGLLSIQVGVALRR